jgi:hypothetical protein
MWGGPPAERSSAWHGHNGAAKQRTLSKLEGVFTFDLEQKTRQLGLPNLDLKLRHKHFRMAPSFDLGGISRLEEEFDGLLQIRTSGLDAVALARNIELWTESNVSIALVQ